MLRTALARRVWCLTFTYVSMPDPEVEGQRLWWVDLRAGESRPTKELGPAPTDAHDRVRVRPHRGGRWAWRYTQRLLVVQATEALRLRDGVVQQAVPVGGPGMLRGPDHPEGAALLYWFQQGSELRLSVISNDEVHSLLGARFTERVSSVGWLRP